MENAARNMQRRIHASARTLGLAPQTRRELQLRVTGKASTSEMTETELEAVAAELTRLGAKPAGRRPAATRPDIRFCHVMWRLLGEAGETHNPGRAGLNSFIRARFSSKWGHEPIDIDAMCDGAEINDVVQALKAWCGRARIPLK